MAVNKLDDFNIIKQDMINKFNKLKELTDKINEIDIKSKIEKYYFNSILFTK